MIWESWSDFFAMGGYGAYVWGSYFMAVICIFGEIVFILKRRRTLHDQLSQIHKLTTKKIINETTS